MVITAEAPAFCRDTAIARERCSYQHPADEREVAVRREPETVDFLTFVFREECAITVELVLVCELVRGGPPEVSLAVAQRARLLTEWLHKLRKLLVAGMDRTCCHRVPVSGAVFTASMTRATSASLSPG